jgi:hypothetical protein
MNTKGEAVATRKGKHDSMIVIFRGKPAWGVWKGERMRAEG